MILKKDQNKLLFKSILFLFLFNVSSPLMAQTSRIEVENSIAFKSNTASQKTKILDFQGSVRYRKEQDTYFYRAQKNDVLNVGDRIVTGPDSWVILETQTAHGRTAASIGPNQLFTVNSKMLPSLQTSLRKQPNTEDVLNAAANSKKIKGEGSSAPLSGFFDLNSIPESFPAGAGSSASEGRKIEGTRFLVEMKGLDVFFPLGAVFLAVNSQKWEFHISLKYTLQADAYLLVDAQKPISKRVETRFLKAGTKVAPISGLLPGEYQWQIFSADSSKRSRLGNIYVVQQKPGLFPLPSRALPGDTILNF
jgi:hypothetical protein